MSKMIRFMEQNFYFTTQFLRDSKDNPSIPISIIAFCLIILVAVSFVYKSIALGILVTSVPVFTGILLLLSFDYYFTPIYSEKEGFN